MMSFLCENVKNVSADAQYDHVKGVSSHFLGGPKYIA